ARLGLAVHGFLGGNLRALAGIERGVERRAIVALLDRRVGALERVFGRGEFLAGVLIRAGGARGIDGALRLLHFLVGRIAARRGRCGRDDRERYQQAAEGHERQYTAASPAPRRAEPVSRSADVR